MTDWLSDWLICWLNERTNKQATGWLPFLNREINQMNECMNEWMNKWMNEWMREWKHEWLNELTNEGIKEADNALVSYLFNTSATVPLLLAKTVSCFRGLCHGRWRGGGKRCTKRHTIRIIWHQETDLFNERVGGGNATLNATPLECSASKDWSLQWVGGSGERKGETLHYTLHHQIPHWNGHRCGPF